MGAGRAIQLYLSTELWPLIKLLGFHTDEVSTTKLIAHLKQPGVAVARVWKSPVIARSIEYGGSKLPNSCYIRITGRVIFVFSSKSVDIFECSTQYELHLCGGRPQPCWLHLKLS